MAQHVGATTNRRGNALFFDVRVKRVIHRTAVRMPDFINEACRIRVRVQEVALKPIETFHTEDYAAYAPGEPVRRGHRHVIDHAQYMIDRGITRFEVDGATATRQATGIVVPVAGKWYHVAGVHDYWGGGHSGQRQLGVPRIRSPGHGR